MRKILKKVLLAIISLVVLIVIFGLILAFLPMKLKTNHAGITPEEAAVLRKNYRGTT